MSNRTRLFCDRGEFDLSSDSPVALTFQINDLGNPANQQGNTSNQFQLPDTQNNRILLGFPNDVNFNNPVLSIQIAYTKIPVRIIQNDIEILPSAVMELSDPAYDTNVFNVTILSGNVSFFDLIGGQLVDMGDSTSQWSNFGANLVWKPYDHVWDLQNAANSQQNTATSGNNGLGGWIYPVVDYGLMTDDFTQPIDVRYMRPGFFIKTAIDLMLKFTGYKAKGSLLSNPLYPKLIAQFSNGTWDHGIDYQNAPDNRGINVSQSQQVTLNHPNVHNPTSVANWNTINSDKSHQFHGGQLFTSIDISAVGITVTFPRVKFHGRVTPTDDSSKLLARIMYRDPVNGDASLSSFIFGFDGHGEKNNRPGSDPKGWTRISGSGGNIVGEIDIFNSVVSFQTTLPTGGIIFILYEFQGLTGSWAAIYPGATFAIKSQKDSVQFGQTVQCERIFPGVSQKDLIKDTLQRFGIICQTDAYAKTITFASLGDIVNNIPVAKDWSDKLLNQQRQVSLIFPNGNFSQVNYLEYRVDPNSGLTEIPSKYAWSKINVRNQTLSAIGNDLLVSIFGASINRPYYGDSVALIQMIDPTDDSKSLSISVAPRILIDQKLDIMALGKTVTFTNGTDNVVINDVISTPYFIKPGVPDNMNLDWEKLRLLYYPVLEKILANCKVQTEYFLLTAKDMSELDFFIPIYLEQYSSFYYINHIANWIENVPVKVTLVKIG
jgi:hypothetical protein